SARSARVPRPHERREGGGQYGEAPRPHERREVKVQQRPIRRAAATARAPRGPGAEAANTARRCLSGDRRASAACSTLLLRLLPGLDLPPCVVPTRITKLPNGVRDSASPPRMSGEQHRDGDFGSSALMMPSKHRLLVFSMRKKMI
uniref:Uncharacterized protein n=3 Tax=Aegilops tauschii subsp. strangulata TaxID=200361 RepID=A0A453EGR6_AEGTS